MLTKTMTTLEFLELLSARHDGASDYRVAKMLGAKQQLTSQWRNGTVMSDNWAIKVADALKMPRAYVVACVNAERLKDAERFGDPGRVWRQIADAFRDQAALYLLVAALGLSAFAAPYAHAAGRADVSEVRENVYYGKSRKRRRERCKLRRSTSGRLRIRGRRKPRFAQLCTANLHSADECTLTSAVNTR